MPYDAKAVREGLPWKPLVEALREAFRQEWATPPRHHHTIPVSNGQNATLLIMPAWQQDNVLGIKLARVFPDNHQQSLPSIHADYLLYDATTGVLLASIDGGELTARRTAAASALAADYLARKDARHMLMVGTGRLAANLICAHRSVRDIAQVDIWGRSTEKAEELARTLQAENIPARAVTDLEASSAQADIISCATLSETPLIHGAWLKPGSHLDLVGAFKPQMRECDDDAITQARIFVDTRDGVLAEGGDILQVIEAGKITPEALQADLYELTRGAHPGRQEDSEYTVFKSVGTALEDLAAALLLYRQPS
jgi:alanine dehydrogenase